MGIHRARFALAVIALAGLAGCQSDGGSVWNSNPFASKTASNTSMPDYPPRPSTLIDHSAGTNASTSGSYAGRSSMAPRYSNATQTAYDAPSGTTGGVSAAIPGAAPSRFGSSGESTSTSKPTVSPQRGLYSGSTYNPGSSYNSGSRLATGGVNVPGGIGSHGSNDATARPGTTSSGSSFRSGARDYTSPSTDRMTSSTSNNADSARSGAIIPRYGASADRYGAAADRTTTSSDRSTAADPYRSGTDRGASNPVAAGADRYGSGSRSDWSYNSTSPRSSANDPVRDGARSPSSFGPSGPDRSSAVYANPYANPESSRPSSSSYDRPSTPNYRDYTATGGSESSAGTGYRPSAGSYPATGSSQGPSGDYPSGPARSAASGGEDRSGNSGYNSPASDFRSGATGYNPLSAPSSYRPSNVSAAGTATVQDDAPPFRPGSTSDYVPRSSTSNPTSTAASRDGFNSRVDTSVRPTGYSAGTSDYRR